ncbi:hypothetical protein P43SY_005083 [Pythium insidiosum]|uniref:EF-hand domain-containing protein n=1 Tax=Pythium insidiosum TaxID=114742 RepID=A0AAD5LH89_PYTIN|nr:hypothetical protein P43SY_005083 [Pythium insidiosum]
MAATGTAAALQQYQACLGIMLRLQVEDLAQLKLDFERVGRGLTLHEFVAVMLDRVAWDEDSVLPFIEDLVELFAQVDVNGDGTMEWEEFTSAIIEGGMGTISDEADWRDMQYEEHTGFADVINRPPRRVQYLPEFKRLLVHDNARPVIEIVDPSTLFNTESDDGAGLSPDSAALQTVPGGGVDAAGSFGDAGVNGGPTFTPTLTIANKFHPQCYIAGYRRDQDNVRSERSPVQAVKYLSGVDLLAVSGGDLKITFWLPTILTAASASALETPTPVAIVHTPRPQRKHKIVSDAALMRQEYFGPYSRDDVVNLYRTFQKIDKDQSGTITLRELVDGAGLFGSAHLRDNIMSIFSSVDKDQSGHIDLEELGSAVFNEASPDVLENVQRLCKLLATAEKAKREKKRQLTKAQLDEVKQLFRLYDTDKNGDIDVDELFTALQYNERFYDSSDRERKTSSISKEDVQRIIARFDMNTNSSLDLNEFIELFREEL